MTGNIINQDALAKHIMEQINKEMLTAAEPAIKAAMENVEKEMRKKMAESLISFVESSFSMERFGPDLRIIVKRSSV